MLGFVVFGPLVEILLIAFFASHIWRPGIESPIGRIVYGLGLVAAFLAIGYAAAGQPWYLATAFLLYAIWAGFGEWVDVVQPIAWREPTRWSILIPYAALLIASLFAFWIPLWWVSPGLWVAFGALYAVHTTLNALSHRRPSHPPSARRKTPVARA